jgi:LPS-assembly protein
MNRVLGFLLFSLLFSIPLAAQSSRFKFIPGPKPGGGEVKFTVAPGGESEAQGDEYVVAHGGVTIEYQDIKLDAYKVTFNQKTKDVTAQGNVVITQGPTRLSGDRAVYNLDSKTGTFFNATGTMDPSMFFYGDQIEKVDEDTYRLTNGVFTSCDLDRPAWSFRLGSAEVTVDDYAHLRNVSIRARRLPIFWTPYLVWPTKRDRTRGFLIPRLNLGSKYGERLTMAYFIPFGDSADATINAELSTRGYHGGGVQIRYLPSENVKIGDFNGVAVRDIHAPGTLTERPPGTAPSIQWRYHYRHSQDNLPGAFRGVVDIEDFSNLDFFRDWDPDPRLTHLSQIYSSAYLTKNRPKYSLNILTDRREILLSGRDPQRFEQLPSLQYRMYPQRIGRTPLYFSLESSASQLRTNAVRFTSTEEVKYFRTDFFPTLSLQLKTPSWFSIRPQISVRETYYSDSLASPGQVTPTSGESVQRFYAQGQIEVVGPSFSRIFSRSVGGFSRFKHVIEPRFRYLYTSDANNQEQVIRFDTVDSPFLPIVRDTVEYSLTQRLIGKETREKGSAREVLSLTLRQTASLSKPLRTATGSSRGGDEKFSPLTATLRFNPYQSITVDANATVGNVTRQLEQSSLSANLIGSGLLAERNLGFTWFATYEDPRTGFGESSQFRVSAGSPIIRGRLRADVHVNYDATQRTFIERRYSLGYTGSCYGLTVAYRQFIVYDARRGEYPDGVFYFSFSLKNVGTFGSAQ